MDLRLHVAQRTWVTCNSFNFLFAFCCCFTPAPSITEKMIIQVRLKCLRHTFLASLAFVRGPLSPISKLVPSKIVSLLAYRCSMYQIGPCLMASQQSFFWTLSKLSRLKSMLFRVGSISDFGMLSWTRPIRHCFITLPTPQYCNTHTTIEIWKMVCSIGRSTGCQVQLDSNWE
jgi:hypothetical protein